MTSPYRTVLTRPGAARFSAAGAVARLPLSVVGLALVIVVEGREDSFAYASTVSAAYVLAAAALAPVQGRLLDEWGQTRILCLGAVGFAAGLSLTIGAIATDAGPGWVHLAAASAGAATPHTGNMVRARWARTAEGSDELNTAFAVEAILDETVFIVGPVLATFLTLQVQEFSGLLLATVAGSLGSLALAAQRSTAPPTTRRSTTPREPFGQGLLGPVVAASVGMGVIFGSAEVIVVAFTQEQGSDWAAGPLLAIWAAGSLAAGVLVGLLPAPRDVLRRLRVMVALLTATFVPLLLLPTVPLLAAGLFVAGAAISPTLVAATHLVQAHVPASRLTEALSWTTLGLSVGIAPGAALAGWVVDHAPASWGASAAFTVPLAAGLLATVVAWLVTPPAQARNDTGHTASQSPSSALGWDRHD